VSAPATLDDLLAVSGETARALAGADQTAWNGVVIGSSSIMLGLAHWDGTLYLDNECILDPLRHLYDHAGENRPTSALIAYREALATLLHEQAHFLGPFGATQEAARTEFARPGSRELEEGVTEAWAQDHLDDYIRRLGIDKVAPGIESVRSTGYYPAFVPAVRDLTTELEIRNDLPTGQILSLLNQRTAADQFPLLVTLVHQSTKLPELDPPGVNSRTMLEPILRQGLAALDAFELNPPEVAAAKSHDVARALLQQLDSEIQRTESAYTFAPVRAATPSPTRIALSGVAPPHQPVPLSHPPVPPPHTSPPVAHPTPPTPSQLTRC
jgi:hypothetical protein